MGAGAATGWGTKDGGGRGHGDDRHDLGRGVARVRDGIHGRIGMRAHRRGAYGGRGRDCGLGLGGLGRALGGGQGGGEAGGRGVAGQRGSELDGGRHRLGHDRGVVVEQRRSRRVGRQERRAAGLRLDLDDGLLEEAGHAALEALAATDHYGVGAELLAHLGEGVGQAAGAEGLGGGGGVHREGSLLGSRDTTGEQ